MHSRNERIRSYEQELFDASHPQKERNKHGQFATPYNLAREIAEDLLFNLKEEAPSILEPSCGTGAFISAIQDSCTRAYITGVEKDSSLSAIAQQLWNNENCHILNEDFFDYALSTDRHFDAIIANPPYSRHHHLSKTEKDFYNQAVNSFSGVQLSGLAGLHAYFLLMGLGLLKQNGLSYWLIPSELFSVNYGSPIRDFLTKEVSLVRIHFFDPENLQFDDALVTSCVAVIQNKKPNQNTTAEFTYGNFNHPRKSIHIPLQALRQLPKWQHLEELNKGGIDPKLSLGDFFIVKRGIATGGNSFFMRPRYDWHADGISDTWLTPILPPPRIFHIEEITNDDSGWPKESDIALLTIPKTVNYEDMPLSIKKYLAQCPEKIRNGYISRHRNPWYSIGPTPCAPIVCTYMSRSQERPFRFIRNKSNATMTNSYLGLYPRTTMTEDDLDTLCDKLNNISANTLITGGREYGGGLKKMEPRELMSLPFSF